MFNAILINANSARRQALSAVVSDSGLLVPQHVTDQYPPPLLIIKLCRQFAPDLIFLDLEVPEDALACLARIRERCPDTPIIGVGGHPARHPEFTAGGVSFFLASASDFVSIASVVARAMRAQAAHPLDNLFAFLPAKAGAGASTVALCTATSLAGPFDQRTLCIDADLRSGIHSAIVGPAEGGGTQAALAHSDDLDDLRWHNFVHHRHGVDFLLASEDAGRALPQWTNYYRLLRFVQTRYDSIIVDLPELVNPATEEIVRRSHSVFVVTTQESTSLHLADRRLKELDRCGIPLERAYLVVNRWNRHDTPLASIKAQFGDRIAACVPDSGPALRAALRSAQLPLRDSAEPGRSLKKFAQLLAGYEEPNALQQARQWAAGLGRLLVNK